MNSNEFLKHVISDSTGILLIADNKIGNSFTTSQFVIKGFIKRLRYDQNHKGGGLLI